jgi:hypothetical protein
MRSFCGVLSLDGIGSRRGILSLSPVLLLGVLRATDFLILLLLTD